MFAKYKIKTHFKEKGKAILFLGIFLMSLLSIISIYLAPSGFFDFRESAHNQVRAFPGAEGFGAYSKGGRGGEVYEVTNLQDDGPGSLRACVEASGPRYCIFRISGNIKLQSSLKIQNPYITIAGQTAPGDGICIQNFATVVLTHNVVIRYMRFRLGDITQEEVDSLTIVDSQNVIIDHCSVSWGIDEVLSVVDEKGTSNHFNNVTVQWTIISEALNDSYHDKGPHGYGSIMGGNAVGWVNEQRTNRISLHHNLYAHNVQRNPRIASAKDVEPGVLVDMRNNVVYNWKNRPAENGEQQHGDVNFVGNYFKPGPSTNSKKREIAFYPKSVRLRMFNQGNYLEGFAPGNEDNWKLIYKDRVKDKNKMSDPFPVAHVQTHTAQEAYEKVLEQVGAVLPQRDAVDTRIVNNVRNNTGQIIDSQNQVGSWPVLQSANPPVDSDHDGMPDTWETEYGLDPNDKTDNKQDLDEDGYTNIEEYLNNTIPTGDCVPDCTGKTCGDDGCGGSCGACEGETECVEGNCTNTTTCVPDCTDKACGDNGCGGSCGTCGNNEICEESVCEALDVEDSNIIDLNNDGEINNQDYLLFVEYYIVARETGEIIENADLNGDEEVNLKDYKIFIEEYNK
jgi:hypothetical protein